MRPPTRMSTRKYCSKSCTNCRVKKRRCDENDVCQNCVNLKLQCIRPQLDKRTSRITTYEAQRLRESNASLDSAMRRIQDAISTVRGQDQRHLLELLQKTEAVESFVTRKNKRIPMSVDASSGGELSVFGPTSALHSLLSAPAVPKPIEFFSCALEELTWLTASLKNFFTWMYPDITVFVHRESFLGDFLDPKSNRGYCSEELLFSIAAIGAKCLSAGTLRDLAPTFYERARSSIFSKKICVPQINTLQALLCLSLYELGDGNTSASWMLSGMAFRMGYDLGFQLNPSDWNVEEGNQRGTQEPLITDIDVTIRSRIYWGCFILDSFISLIMGRPVTVRKTEASIPSSEVLPNSSDIDAFIFQSPHSGQNLDAFQTIEPLCSLSECAGSLLTDIYSVDATEDKEVYLDPKKLRSYNKYLSKWKDGLPEALRWTRDSLEHQAYNPTAMNYKLYYYIVIISLNRPFLNNHNDSTSNAICEAASAELSLCLSQFRDSGGRPSVLIIYSSVLAMSISLATILKHKGALLEKRIEELEICYSIVLESQANWQLAAKALLFIHKKVEEINIPLLTETLNFNKSGNADTPQAELFNLMMTSPDAGFWATQDNLFANFFDFMD